jgi:transglutaminase-like putative cysteine protease
MSTPPLILGAALVFWGWQTGLLVVASIMALILEGSRVGKLRWEFSFSDFNRITDLSVILFLGMLIYLYASQRSTHAILVLIQWLPMALFPILACQIYSTREGVNIGALFWIFRRKGAEDPERPQPVIDLTYPYLALCLLAASAANVRTVWFYLGVLCLSAWALWPKRSKRYSPVLWLCLLALAGASGYLGHKALHRFQLALENKAVEWFSDLMKHDPDPFKTRTAIGDIGSLKPSDRIVFRVKPESQIEVPFLLRDATYNLYKSTRWFARRSTFTPLQADAGGTSWVLQPKLEGDQAVAISSYLKDGKGVLKLPKGACFLAQLPVAQASRNQFGAVKVENGPGLVNYEVRYNEATSLNSIPDETDLIIPPQELPALSKIVQDLELIAKPPEQIMQAIATNFRRNYTYSLKLDSSGGDVTPLTDFLLRSQAGHCEYFATATVLLLRAVSIPARYATGYSVHEKSPLEGRFVVRERHAHAWALVYLEGAWQDFDTTPSSWRNLEAEAASIWEPVFDFWSWCVFKFSGWRWSEQEGGLAKHIWWLLIPLALLLGWRLYSRKRVTRAPRTEEVDRAAVKPGAASEFYLIERKLGEMGFLRFPWESLSAWIERIEDSGPLEISTDALRPMLNLHYRYRFDPNGVSEEEKLALSSEVQSWLEQHPMVGGGS